MAGNCGYWETYTRKGVRRPAPEERQLPPMMILEITFLTGGYKRVEQED